MRRTTILLAALAALMLVPAAQAFGALPTMKVNVTGTGNGEVTSGAEGEEPGEIVFDGTPPLACAYASPGPATGVCENTIDDELEPGEGEPYAIWLNTIPSEGSIFAGWTTEGGIKLGGCKTGPFCFMGAFENEELEVTANFECEAGPGECEEAPPIEGPPLTTVIEEGTGTVVSDPAGIECTGEAPHECSTEEIAEGQVTLTASPAAGYRFKSWKGCDKKNIPVSGDGVNGRQCTITLNEAKSVSAKFVKTWDVTLENGGGGKVSTKPGGALCLPSCSETTASFDEGKNVEVLTKPNKHFHLVEFGGDCSGSSCTLSSISADHTVSASFAEDTKFALDISKEGGGTGLVKTKGPGTVCSYTCSSSTSSFYEGEEVEVSWKLGKGTDSIAFSGEAGDCPASSEAETGSCHVTMGAAHSLTATLE